MIQLNHIKSQYSPTCPMIPMWKSGAFQVKSRTARVFRWFFGLPCWDGPLLRQWRRGEQGAKCHQEPRERHVWKVQKMGWWGTAIHRNRKIIRNISLKHIEIWWTSGKPTIPLLRSISSRHCNDYKSLSTVQQLAAPRYTKQIIFMLVVHVNHLQGQGWQGGKPGLQFCCRSIVPFLRLRQALYCPSVV